MLQVYGRHVAVHNLTLPLRIDEMTALLGHNGAGAPVICITLLISALSVDASLVSCHPIHVWCDRAPSAQQSARLSGGVLNRNCVFTAALQSDSELAKRGMQGDLRVQVLQGRRQQWAC